MTFLRTQLIYGFRLSDSKALEKANREMGLALSADEISEALGLHGEIFKRRHWSVLPCSAFTGEGLVEGMTWCVSDVAARCFVGE